LGREAKQHRIVGIFWGTGPGLLPGVETLNKETCMDTVLAWIFSLITAAAPPGRPTFVEAQETKEEAVVRYQEIAKDVAEVVYDSDTRPLFRGPHSRSQTVSVVLAIMLYESGFRKDVDFNLGKRARGDSGDSWCLMQVNIGTGRTRPWNTVKDRPALAADNPEDVFEGYTGDELIADRKTCIREGLKVVRMSMYECSSLPIEQQLRSYTSGSCERGALQSAVRMGTAINWFEHTKRNFRDADVVKYLKETGSLGQDEPITLNTPDPSPAQ
jgi:hypothetical protein